MSDLTKLASDVVDIALSKLIDVGRLVNTYMLQIKDEFAPFEGSSSDYDRLPSAKTTIG